jgi:hypothetical protein
VFLFVIWAASLKNTRLPLTRYAKSAAEADIRFIMDGPTGNMIHSTVPPS